MIDAYCHCGISKYLPLEDVLAATDHAGMARAVLVQHIGEYDNRYLAELTAAHPGRFAAVGLVDPAPRDWPQTLVKLNEMGHFAGHINGFDDPSIGNVLKDFMHLFFIVFEKLGT